MTTLTIITRSPHHDVVYYGSLGPGPGGMGGMVYSNRSNPGGAQCMPRDSQRRLPDWLSSAGRGIRQMRAVVMGEGPLLLSCRSEPMPSVRLSVLLWLLVPWVLRGLPRAIPVAALTLRGERGEGGDK